MSDEQPEWKGGWTLRTDCRVQPGMALIPGLYGYCGCDGVCDSGRERLVLERGAG